LFQWLLYVTIIIVRRHFGLFIDPFDMPLLPCFVKMTSKITKIHCNIPDKVEDGTGIIEKPKALFHSENRYRDLAFSPDGKTIYVITDSEGPVQSMNSNANGSVTLIKNPGALIAFRYEGNSSIAAAQ
jgi:hypothetical protein